MSFADRTTGRIGDPNVMRICFLSSDFTPETQSGTGGGIETYVRPASRGLPSRLRVHQGLADRPMPFFAGRTDERKAMSVRRERTSLALGAR